MLPDSSFDSFDHILHRVVVIDRKKAEDEYRRREDWRHKNEVLDHRHQELQDTSSTHAGSSDTVSGDAPWHNCQQMKQGSVSQLSSEGTRESGRQFFLTNVPSSQVGMTGADGGTTETNELTIAPSLVEAASSVTTTSRPIYRKKYVAFSLRLSRSDIAVQIS